MHDPSSRRRGMHDDDEDVLEQAAGTTTTDSLHLSGALLPGTIVLHVFFVTLDGCFIFVSFLINSKMTILLFFS
jgi:hypothetical protein